MVAREVVVGEVAETRIEHALLVQRHRQPHCHPANKLRAGGFGVYHAPNAEDAEQPGYAYLACLAMDARLRELRAKRMHREPLRLGVGISLARHLNAFSRDDTAVLLVERRAQL